MQACLDGKNVEESSFNHCACPAKPVLQERSRKQFSPLSRFSEAREGQLSDKKARESSFHHCARPVKPVPACFSGRNDRERSFLHCGGIVKLVQAC